MADDPKKAPIQQNAGLPKASDGSQRFEGGPQRFDAPPKAPDSPPKTMPSPPKAPPVPEKASPVPEKATLERLPSVQEKALQAEFERQKVETGDVGIVGPGVAAPTQRAPLPFMSAPEPEPEPDLTNMNASINTIATVAARFITLETEAIKASLAQRKYGEVTASVERVKTIAAKLVAVSASLRPIVAAMDEAEAKSKLRP